MKSTTLRTASPSNIETTQYNDRNARIHGINNYIAAENYHRPTNQSRAITTKIHEHILIVSANRDRCAILVQGMYQKYIRLVKFTDRTR